MSKDNIYPPEEERDWNRKISLNDQGNRSPIQISKSHTTKTFRRSVQIISNLVSRCTPLWFVRLWTCLSTAKLFNMSCTQKKFLQKGYHHLCLSCFKNSKPNILDHLKKKSFQQKHQKKNGFGSQLWNIKSFFIGKMVVPLGWYPSCS